MRDRSPVNWVERSKTEERGPTDSARQRRHAAQRSNTREVSRCISPARIPGRLTASGLVSSARIAFAIYFARQCGASATYRRISFSTALAICRCIATAGMQWRLKELAVLVLGRLFSIQTKSVPCGSRFGKSRRNVITCARSASPPGAVHTADRCERTACDCSAIARRGTTLFPRPAALRLWPRRETLAQRHARWPRRISLRDGAQRVRAYMATGGLHTFARTRQRPRGCAQ